MRHAPKLSLLAAGIALLCLAVPGRADASCKNRTGFAIFQCGDRAWFDPPPEGAGAVKGVFWQLGFGNALVANGKGSTGVGIAPPGTFNGNDSGLWEVPVVSARSILRDERVPEGAVCLGPANWANPGVDGCCDDTRDPAVPVPDGLLNPYFKPREARVGEIVASLEAVQDFPMAILLTEETGRFFAVAAISSMDRHEDPNDARPGSFSLADVADGGANPVTGAANLIPWQKAPEIRLEAGAAAGEGRWRVRASWDPVRVPSDKRHIPSEAYQLATPGKGVGVPDLGPLVRYVVEKASVSKYVLGPGGFPAKELLVWESVSVTRDTEAAFDLPADGCARVKAILGMEPRSSAITVNNCALGRCGDIGYEINGPARCLEGPVLEGAASAR